MTSVRIGRLEILPSPFGDATEEAIVELETELGYRLPSEYREFLAGYSRTPA